MGLKTLKRRTLHHHSGQPAAVLCHPHSKEVPLYFEVELPGLQGSKVKLRLTLSYPTQEPGIFRKLLRLTKVQLRLTLFYPSQEPDFFRKLLRMTKVKLRLTLSYPSQEPGIYMKLLSPPTEPNTPILM